MKNKIFSLGCCLMVLLATIFTSCSTDLAQQTMVKITYSTEYAEAPKSNDVALGTILQDKDLPVLEYEGYSFAGWYIGSEKVEKGYKVSKAVTLTAKWVKTYTVTFETDKGTAPKPISGIVDGSCLTKEQLKELTFDGYYFEGWFDANTKVTPTYKITKDTTLTAKWTLETVLNFVTISYVSDNGAAPESKQILCDSEISEANLPKLEKTNGLNFAGWYIGDKKIDSSYKVTSDITLKACWLNDTELINHVKDNFKMKTIYLSQDKKPELPPTNIDGVNIDYSFNNYYVDKTTKEFINRPTEIGRYNNIYITIYFYIGNENNHENYKYFYVRDYNASQQQYDQAAVNEIYNDLITMINFNSYDSYGIPVNENYFEKPSNLKAHPNLSFTVNSSDVNVIGNDFTVKHEDTNITKPVTLTFTIEQNNERKEYILNTKVLNATKETITAVDTAIDALVKKIPTEIKEDVNLLELPTTSNNLAVEWFTYSDYLDINNGECKVTHDSTGQKNIETITASITNGNYFKNYDFEITLLSYENKESDFERIFDDTMYNSEDMKLRINFLDKTKNLVKIAYGYSNTIALEYKYSVPVINGKAVVKLTYTGDKSKLSAEEQKYCELEIDSFEQINLQSNKISIPKISDQPINVSSNGIIEYFATSTSELLKYPFDSSTFYLIHLNQDNITNIPSDWSVKDFNNYYIVDEGVTTLKESSFANFGIESIYLPDSLLSIENYAFANTLYIKTLELPKNVASLGAFIFSRSNITSLTIKGKLTNIHKQAFAGSFLEVINYQGGTIEEWKKLTTNVENLHNVKVICSDGEVLSNVQ